VNISSKATGWTSYVNDIDYSAQASSMTYNTFTQPFNRNFIVVFMTSFWVQTDYGYVTKCQITAEVVNGTHYRLTASVKERMMVTNWHVSQVIFNADDVESSERYSVVFETWTADVNGGFRQFPAEFKDNFIMGITSFEASLGECGFEYQWEYATQMVGGVPVNGISILLSVTVNNMCGFSLSESSILYMMTWQCGSPFLYFNLTTRLCQTECGGYTV
jgi:hypothetical protein